MSQSYDTHVSQEYVIQGNDAIVKCGIPSFVSDFVTVVGWVDNGGETILPSISSLPKGNSSCCCFAVVFQDFKTHVDSETYVIIGNDAILKCDVPSFVGDLVSVVSWHDNQGEVFHMATQSMGKRILTFRVPILLSH